MLKDENTFLIYTLLTNGKEQNISNKILKEIECKILSDEERKEDVIENLIDTFKRKIIKTIKETANNRKIEKGINLNTKKGIKQQAQENYNAAIDGHNEGKITLHFYDAYNVRKVKGDLEIAKNVKLSALFDYVLYNGRTFYYFNAEENQEKKDNVIKNDIIEDNKYTKYDNEKARLELRNQSSPIGAKILKKNRRK